MTSFTVDSSNPTYSSSDGVLLDKSQATLIEFPPGRFGAYVIPAQITSLGDYSFYGSTLYEVTIPDAVTNIGNHAFNSAYSLASITIPAAVTSIGTDAFSACTSLAGISVDASSVSYSSADGVLFDKSKSVLIQAPGGFNGGYSIPNSVARIGTDAFFQCFNLTSVAIPNGITQFGDYAFYQCTSLTNAALPSALTDIGSYTFASCSLLTSMTIPQGVTNIGSYVFNSCYALTNVSIPKSVDQIGSEAFSSCNSLKSAYFYGNAPTNDGSVFSGDSSATAYYLSGTTGWGPKYSGIPTQVWTPQAGAQAQAVGLVDGKFGFGLTGPSDAVVVIQASTNLTNPTWIPISTNTLTGGAFLFSDSHWTNYVQRFFRFQSEE